MWRPQDLTTPLIRNSKSSLDVHWTCERGRPLISGHFVGTAAAPHCTCCDLDYSQPLATAMMRFLHIPTMDDVEPFFEKLRLAARDTIGHVVLSDTHNWQVTCMNCRIVLCVAAMGNGQVRLVKNEMGHEVPKGNQLWCFTCASRLSTDAQQICKLYPLVTEKSCLALLHFIQKAGPRKVPATPVENDEPKSSTGSTLGGETAVDFQQLLESTDDTELYRTVVDSSHCLNFTTPEENDQLGSEIEAERHSAAMEIALKYTCHPKKGFYLRGNIVAKGSGPGTMNTIERFITTRRGGDEHFFTHPRDCHLGLVDIHKSSMFMMGGIPTGTKQHADAAQGSNTLFDVQNLPTHMLRKLDRLLTTDQKIRATAAKAGGYFATWWFCKPAVAADLNTYLAETYKGSGGLMAKHRDGEWRLTVEEMEAAQAAMGLDERDRYNIQIYHQKAGETLYVPSGWIHQVINHRPNIKIVWDFLEPKMLDRYVWTHEHINTKLFDPNAGQPGDYSNWSTWMDAEIQEIAKECPAFLHSKRVRLHS